MADHRCAHCPGSHTGERPCLASATTGARSWLLIEHPGPWAERVEATAVPGPVADVLRRAGRHGVRVQFIRAPRGRRPTPPLWVYTGFSGDGAPDGRPVTPWLEGRELTRPEELAGLDLAAVAAGRPPGFGGPVADPLLLVCAHGRRNACCARTGAPLARALRERFGSQVWETTHVGGDRYAANLVCLPHGLYYGDLDERRAVAAAAAYRYGEVVLDRYRGRAGLPEPVQAAEHFVRAHTGILAVGGVAVESMVGDTAVVRAGQARYRVRVARADLGGCGAECSENLATYVKRDLALLNGAALV
ncbi:sucrase ferredoxin [Actinoallomurus soli]|uniref:sucrase ferredoxin n=1 Tax=Actinoallomurus soli TaxID=2952535 RepID=UPI0020920780|nr:sucrase ferredoxin [Actinoallomurus soli]MCO5970506.1 sucrase ferredoxin [Actinoallomurus soli]